MATVDVLLDGFSFRTNKGSPGFCSVTLVESEGRLILVDPAHVGRRRELGAALEQRGLTEANVDTVVLTHAHWDHAQNFDRFTEAPLLLHPRERAYASAPHENDWATPPWTGLALETHRIQEVAEGDEVAAGVRVIELPGHSRQPPIVFGSLSQARESVAKALSAAEIIYPGHDQPFRVVEGRADYLKPFALTIMNLEPDREGLRFDASPMSTWVMDGSAP